MAFTGNWASNVFKTGMLDGVYDFGPGTTDVYKIALYTNAATLDATTPGYTTVGETNGIGYNTGGEILTITTVPTSTQNITFLSFANAVWTGATFTARGALIYKADGLTNPAVCVLDFGSDKSAANGTFIIQFPPATNTSAVIRIV